MESNNYSFYATLSANVEIDVADFNMIHDCAAKHYDHTVQSSTVQGGFLYGLKNKREFSKNEDKVCDLSVRELGLVLKAIEFDMTEDATRMHRRLMKIMYELHKKQDAINIILSTEQK